MRIYGLTKNLSQGLSHGYALFGDVDDIRESLLESIKNDLKIVTTGNPDFFHEKFETLTIDDSRRIKEIASVRQFGKDLPRIFVIEMYGATREAQNALLKLLEEPEPGNHFFIITTSSDVLLPTLRSRLHIINYGNLSSKQFQLSEKTGSVEKKGGGDGGKIALKLSKMSLAEKIAYVDALAGDISDEKLAKHEALNFLNELEKALHNETKREEKGRKIAFEKNAQAFKAISHARTYMNDRAPSLKMLLEYVILAS